MVWALAEKSGEEKQVDVDCYLIMCIFSGPCGSKNEKYVYIFVAAADTIRNVVSQ